MTTPADRLWDTLLTHIATDPDPQVRSSAAEALGRLGTHQPPPDRLWDTLLTHIATDPDPQVRSSAAEALGRVGEQLPDSDGGGSGC